MRGYAAYIRKSPASPSLRAQKKDLESIATLGQHQIVEWFKDPGLNKAGDLQRNESLQRLLNRLCDDLDLIGVMFWHVGHIAREMDDFLTIAYILEKINKEKRKRFGINWYIHNQKIWGNELYNELYVEKNLFEFLRETNKEILSFSRMDIKNSYKQEDIKNPGKPRISENTEKKIVSMRKKGMKIQEISDAVHVSKSTVHRVIKEAGL